MKNAGGGLGIEAKLTLVAKKILFNMGSESVSRFTNQFRPISIHSPGIKKKPVVDLQGPVPSKTLFLNFEVSGPLHRGVGLKQ